MNFGNLAESSSSVVGHMLSVHKALASVLSIKTNSRSWETFGTAAAETETSPWWRGPEFPTGIAWPCSLEPLNQFLQAV